jgi:hypothetical protein
MNFRCFVLVALALNIGVALAQSPSSQQGVKVEFSHVPSAGMGSDSRGNIDGNVLGLKSPEEYKIVLYAHTDQWYVQPLVKDPYTDLDSNGHWTNWTHLGDRYAALVVRPSFRPSTPVQALPSVGGDVVARGEVPAAEK